MTDGLVDSHTKPSSTIPVEDLWDAHCHWDWEGFDDHRSRLVDAARRSGVRRWILPGTVPARWTSMTALTETYPGFFMAPGVHPQSADLWSPDVADRLRTMGEHPRSVAIGEIGMDPNFPVAMDLQRQVFIEQLTIAAELKKPVLLHVRHTHAEVLAIVKAFHLPGVVWHAYSGSAEIARELGMLGHFVSICGSVTYANHRKINALLRTIPPELLVVETDAPDIAPLPHRGTTCLPEYLTLTVTALSERLSMTPADGAALLTRNTLRLFPGVTHVTHT